MRLVFSLDVFITPEEDVVRVRAPYCVSRLLLIMYHSRFQLVLVCMYIRDSYSW